MSGGLDSFAISVLVNKRGYEIHPIIVNYGQRAKKEIEVAETLCNKMGFVSPLKINLGGDIEKMWSGLEAVDRNVRLQVNFHPAMLVPLRNVIFLVIAASYALKIGAEAVCYGALMDDIELFPDNRPEVAKIVEELVKYAHPPVYVHKLDVISPATEGLAKHELIKVVYGIVGDMLSETWSCRSSEDKHCGECRSCLQRHEAFVKAGVPDKTEYLKKPILGGMM